MVPRGMWRRARNQRSERNSHSGGAQVLSLHGGRRRFRSGVHVVWSGHAEGEAVGKVTEHGARRMLPDEAEQIGERAVRTYPAVRWQDKDVHGELFHVFEAEKRKKNEKENVNSQVTVFVQFTDCFSLVNIFEILNSKKILSCMYRIRTCVEGKAQTLTLLRPKM